ncbi:HNH endonuclease signature motif containing protein [Haloquadratum walsbyi]|uniref:HNH nuclease domain-containing protein n=1 Tax=Haloquadratum walsbyi J07HQW2 TaxID=1238425 RepID=U1PXK0_9EURY|nr:HNH endonuclease signature motif containing protein [Haloquadratum walsbyi]ERG97191.1 MAG: hypothetical protein J07HQW2_03677 [Haloquadratum walsbyi J07HQW2]
MSDTSRIRSIVPMFGGATNYVDTLDAIIDTVRRTHPDTDMFVSWHREYFSRVSSRESILRRIRYLDTIEILTQCDGRWYRGQAGRRYDENREMETLFTILSRRNVGLRSLLYALRERSMTIGSINDQQLKTHPELGWDPNQTDMALQRVNWLRSMGLVARQDEIYTLTSVGKTITDNAIDTWSADYDPDNTTIEIADTAEYTTVTTTRSVDPEFRATVLHQHESECPISGVDQPALLDVAHVRPWAEYPTYRGDIRNVLPLSKTHHAAFDNAVFTIDRDFRLRVNPEFDTNSTLLQRTILDKTGEQLPLSASDIDPAHLAARNDEVGWI